MDVVQIAVQGVRPVLILEAPAVLHPLVVLAERSGIALRRTDGSILTILQEMVRNRTTFWHWNQEDWRLLLRLYSKATLDGRTPSQLGRIASWVRPESD